MLYKKHMLSILFMIGISLSAYAMHEDQSIDADLQRSDAITEKYKSLFDQLNDSVTKIFLGKSDKTDKQDTNLEDTKSFPHEENDHRINWSCIQFY